MVPIFWAILYVLALSGFLGRSRAAHMLWFFDIHISNCTQCTDQTLDQCDLPSFYK